MTVKKSKKEHYDVEMTKDGLMEKVDTVWYKKLYKVPYYTLKWYVWEIWHKKKREENVGEFIMNNKRLLVIVCDPQTDKMIMGHKGKIVISKIQDGSSRKKGVVKKAIKYSRLNTSIDNLLLGISHGLQLRMENCNHFFKWLDGAIYNISKSLRKLSPLEKKMEIDIEKYEKEKSGK